MTDQTLPGNRMSPANRYSTSWFGRWLYRSEAARGYSLLSPALIFLAIAILVPFGILVVMSFWTAEGFGFNTTITSHNYEHFLERPIYSALLTRSLYMSGMVTVFTVLLCYPMAYYVAFHVHRHKMMWIVLMTLPFWTSYLLRVFAWKVVLGYEGVINSALMVTGLIEKPLEFLLYSQEAVIITLAHAWAAFAILPLYVSLEKIDKSLLEAATDLGDGPAVSALICTSNQSGPRSITVRQTPSQAIEAPISMPEVS